MMNAVIVSILDGIALASRYATSNYRNRLIRPGMLILLACLCLSARAQTGEWTWMGGSNTNPAGPGGCAADYGSPGVYGTLGTAAVGNIPGGRDGGSSWTDSSGHLWLFGGQGIVGNSSGDCATIFNDLWEYNPTTSEWTWISGSSPASPIFSGQPGLYGTLGTPAAANTPGSRNWAASWSDNQGNLWLFGGGGLDASDNDGLLNDLWRFNPSAIEWAWMGGLSTVGQPGIYGTLGAPAASNIPGGRSEVAIWSDSGGNIWFFGGWGFDASGNEGMLSDLWEFNPSTNDWAWMGGSSAVPTSCAGISTGNCGPPGIYGTLGTPAAGNIPGGRSGSAHWTDSQGNFWLFGGFGSDEDGNMGYLNDLWRFNPSTGNWTWMGGSGKLGSFCLTYMGATYCAESGVYGTLGAPAAGNIPGGRNGSSNWTDSHGNLWLFGGGGFDANGNNGNLNDLWEFSPTTNEWAWVGGSSTVGSNGPPGVYGTLGTPATGNIPGGRQSPANWTDSSGNLWLFGGFGFDVDGTFGLLNDLWEYQPPTVSSPAAATPAFSVPGGTYTSTQTVAISDATPGATIYYTADGTTPTTNSTVYSGALSVSSTETIEAIATASGYSTSAVATATYTINIPMVISSLSPAFTDAGGSAFTLTVNGSGFTAKSTVYWGTSALTTTYGSANQLTAQVTEADITSAGTTAVAVQTPAPGGGTSNSFEFEVDTASGTTTGSTFTSTTATVNAGVPGHLSGDFALRCDQRLRYMPESSQGSKLQLLLNDQCADDRDIFDNTSRHL